MFSLLGKKALITGATGGIGGAIAKTYAQAGASLAISGSNAEKLEAFASELSSKQQAASTIVCNLSDLANVDANHHEHHLCDSPEVLLGYEAVLVVHVQQHG